MRLTFFGHASLGLEASQSPSPGTRILFDPYEPGGFQGLMAYPPIHFDPDHILLTHLHLDHAHTAPFPRAQVFGPRDFQEIQSPVLASLGLRALRVAHDPFEGKLRGGHSWCLSVSIDGLRVAHLGDIGELPPPEKLDEWTQREPIDVLFLTCGGLFTIGPDQAAELAWRLRARAILPIHYKTDACGLKIQSPEDLLLRFGKIKTIEGKRVDLLPETMPEPGTVLYLKG